MGGRAGTVIDLLEREWAFLAESPPTSAALRRWGREDETLAQFETIAALVSYVERRATDAKGRDEVLGALGARASRDEQAARTLLQLLLPGAKALVARYRWSAESVDELAAAVVADLYDRIRALPAGVRRPFVAPAVLADVAKRLQRRTARARREEVGLGDIDDVAANEQWEASVELEELLRRAVDGGELSAADAELIVLTRVANVPVAALSAASGEDPQTIRRRRLRAERALAVAARAA